MDDIKKREILEMLAKKEISKEEAEKKLSELGSPLPDLEPPQPTPPKKNKGCLIIILLALILFLLLPKDLRTGKVQWGNYFQPTPKCMMICQQLLHP